MKTTRTLMNKTMAHAYIDGCKTQTRRIIKPAPDYEYFNGVLMESGDKKLKRNDVRFGDHPDLHESKNYCYRRCPYGEPGDRLRLLTTWSVHKRYDHLKPSEIPHGVTVWSYFDGYEKPKTFGKLRPGRFMPNGLSEYSMPEAVIGNIRAEGVKDITNKDALAEGIREVTKDGIVKKYCVYDLRDHSSEPWGKMSTSPKGAFSKLWDSINEKRGYPFRKNNWCWVIDFEGV